MNRLILLLLPLVALTFCDKDPNIQGDPDSDNLAKIDTLVLEGYSLPHEVDNALNQSNVPLGVVNDATFGKREASYYAQLLLTQSSYELGANAVLDSAVLEIALKGKFGPMQQAVTFNVHEMTEALDNNNTYTSETNIAYDNTIIGTVNYIYNENNATLRIPINSAFANDLFSQFGTSTMESNTNLLSYLKGIYITPDNITGGDGHLKLDPTNANSGLKLYFTSDSPNDSLYRFAITTTSLRVNHYEKDLAGSEVQVAFDDATNNDEELYVAGLFVSKARILIPDLSFLQGKVINQAKLTFAQTDYGSNANTDYDEPVYLLLYGEKDNDSTEYLLSDYSVNTPTQYGGTAVLKEVNGVVTNTYSYNIPRFIQRVVNGETELQYFVLQSVNYNTGERIKLGGGNHPNFPIKLEILYTK
ncbi:MAG: DUF4270 family protein [Chitinophagales bacterium]|nr:DUF4270 family protein [Chitinophagales bacterium]